MIDLSHICEWVENPCCGVLDLLTWQRSMIGNLCNLNGGATDIITLLEEIRDALIPLDPAALNTVSYSSPTDIVDDNPVSVLAAPAAGFHYEINAITISNSHETVGTLVNILSGTDLLWSGPASNLFGGVALAFTVPLRAGDDEAISVECVTTGAAVRVSIQATIRPN